MMHNKLTKFFNEKLKYKNNGSLLSFLEFYGDGKKMKMTGDEISVSLSLRRLFKNNENSFINTKIRNLKVEIKPKIENKEQELILPKKKKTKSLEKWIFQKIAFYISAVFIRSAKFSLHNIEVIVKGMHFTFKSITFEYKRDNEVLIADFEINEIHLSKENPCLRIPHLKFRMESTIFAIKYLLTSFVRDFNYKIPKLDIFYNEGKFIISQFSLRTKVPKDEDVDGSIKLSDIQLMFPELDIHTKDLNVLLNDIQLSNGCVKTGNCIATRNHGQPLATFKSMKFSNNIIAFEEAVDFYIATPFLIDIGLIKRFFKGVKDPTKVDPEEERKRKEKSLANNIVVTAPQCNLTLALSDNHVLSIPMTKAVFQSMVITAKNFRIDVVFPNKTFNFLTARSGELNIARPNFALKARDADFTLHSDFAEMSFITETFNLFSFISKQMKGDVSAFRDKQPPTRRRFAFNFESGRVKFQTSELTDTIEAINTAKLDAMQQLKLRQEKAIQILKARNAKTFNEQAFNEESKEQLFRIFKENVEVSNFPKPDPILFSFDFKNLDIVWDGPALPNRQAGLEKLQYIDKNLETETVGRIVGGALTVAATKLGFSVRHAGELVEIDEPKATGWVLNAKANGKKRNEFFHYKVFCDGGLIEYLIPGVSARSVNFINFDLNSKKINVKSAPTFSAAKQDLKLGTALFRDKKYKFRKIYTFDKMRIRCRWLFSIKSEELNVHHFEKQNPYSPTPFLDIVLPKFVLNFDRRVYTVTSNAIFVKIPSPIGSKLLLTMPPPNITCRVISHNPDNKTNGTRPTFVPIDSYRITDREYKPYEQYCTWTYSVHATADFGDSFMSINGDLLQSILKVFMNKPLVVNCYVSPAKYVFRFHPYPTFSFFELNLTLPKISIGLNRDKISMKLTGDPLVVKLSTEEGFKIACNSSSSTITATLCEKELLKMTLVGLDISSREMILIKARSIQGELASDAFTHLSEFNIELPPPKKKKPLPMLTTETELMNHFTTPKFRIEAIESSLKVRLVGTTNAATILMKNMIFEKRKNDTKTSLNIIRVKEFSVFTKGSIPLASIEGLTLHQASGLSTAIKLLSVHKCAVNFRPDDFDDFIPSLQAYTSEKQKEDEVENIKQNRDSLISLTLDDANVVFHHPDGYPMCTTDISGTRLYYLANTDKSAVINFSIASLNAVDELSEDNFKQMFKSTTEHELIEIKIKRAKHIMKRPVIERIEGKVSSFILAISIPFIKTLIAIFPSAKDLKALDIDNDEDEQNAKLATNAPPDDLSESSISDADQINGDGEGVFFCRELIVHPCAAEFSLRRKDQGAFSEFIDRPFNYPGLHMYDIFGTKNQLISFLKKNLKWTVIKALPNFLLGKGKKGPPQPKVALPKPKDME